MNVTVKNLPKSEVMLIVEVPEERMKKFFDRAVKELSTMVKIPGFRPGQAPAEVLKKHLKEGALEAHILDMAMPEVYTEAIKKEDIKAVSKPKINILSTEPLKFEATVAIYPEVKLSGYDKINIPKIEVKVEDKEVDEILNNFQKRHATYKEVDRAAKMGDRAELDFEGFDEGGAVLEGASSKSHPVVLGEGTLVPGFEEEIVGLKKGDKKSFKLTFPKEYFHKRFQSKKVEFKVEVKRVDEIELPELTPKMLKDILGEEQTVAEARGNIKKNLLQDKEHQAKVERENKFLEKLINLTKVELPESLVEEEIEGMMEEFQDELQDRGIELEKYLEQTKKSLEDLKNDRRKEAENRLMLRFTLQQLFKQEKIEASDAEMEKEISHVISLYPENERKKIREDYEGNSYLKRRLENKLKMEKMFERYLS